MKCQCGNELLQSRLQVAEAQYCSMSGDSHSERALATEESLAKIREILQSLRLLQDD